MTKNSDFLFIIFLLILFSLGGCSGSKNITKDSDPFENLNRHIFGFNKYVDQIIVKPVSKAYVQNIPNGARKNISNHLDWMKLPSTISNSFFQFDLENTILASAKFMLNGLTLGFYDLDNGETEIFEKDFGSTLARFNVPEGPFLVIPFLGPKMTRGFSGYFVDRQNMTNVSSTTVNDIQLIEIPVNVIDTRTKLSNTLDKLYNSPDPYTKMKSYYIQSRRKKVYNETYHNIEHKNKDDEFERLLQ